MVMLGGRVLCGSLVMRMYSGVVMRSAVMHVAGLHLVMHRHEIGKERVVKARCWTAAPGEACGRREHAEQIGEGDDPPTLIRIDRVNRNSIPPIGSSRGNLAHADCKLMAKSDFAKLLLTAVHSACPISRHDA